MMEFLNFTFDSFWHFVGVLLLVSAAANSITRIVNGLIIRTTWKMTEPKIRACIVDAIREAANGR